MPKVTSVYPKTFQILGNSTWCDFVFYNLYNIAYLKKWIGCTYG